MKAGTTSSMKFMVLKAKLNKPKYVVIGLLEGLWSMTASSAQDGAIGKYSNDEIAAWLEWDGDADALISAFIASKFIDSCTENRLVVHDWEDHAPQYIKGNISKYGKKFAVPNEPPKDAPKETPKETPNEPPKDVCGGTDQAPSKSSQVKSSQVKREAEAKHARATRLPASWIPSDSDMEYCRNERPDLVPEDVAENFRDFWISKPGKEGTKLDWSATWRTWVRRESAMKRPTNDGINFNSPMFAN